MENIFLAWQKFIRGGKRKKSDVMIFERNLERNLFELQEKIKTGTYKHSLYDTRLIRDPKERVISAAPVCDRVVHQALDNVIKFTFETCYIYDSYACRIGKGIHKASYRLRRLLQKASRSNTRSVYGLKCDVRKFFDTINHEILLRLLKRRIISPGVLQIIEHIIKSFEKTPGRGIPLGNLSSQLFANVYLNELDRFIKHELREKYYLRYCDDFIILSHDRAKLLNLVPKLRNFLKDALKLELHPKKVVVRSWRQGIDFVGYVHKPWAVLVRTKTKERMIKKVNEKNINSYLGVAKHADSHELTQLLKNII
ncbi:MAG: reverse transcriptase domain-containing protein [Patescibacteria group bacterium]